MCCVYCMYQLLYPYGPYILLTGERVFMRFVHYFLKTLPWLMWLVAGLSPQRPLFSSRPVHVVCEMEEVALGQVCCPSTLVFPCRYNSAIAACSLRHLL